MKTKLIKFFNLIKKDKQVKVLTITGIILLFIFTLGYSLSMFTSSQNNKIANIKVNDLSFNITTNSGETNDRILHLQAGKLEQFNIILTNLNKIDVKYEFTYELCNNQNCTETSKNIPSDISVSKEYESSEVSGTINSSKTKSLTILTNNKSNNDYYIKLNLNAGYIWNDLELANQIKEYSKVTNIVAYVDGIETNDYPSSCNYTATAKGYVGNQEVPLENLKVSCNSATNKWTTTYTGYADKIEVNFAYGTVLLPESFANDSWATIAANTTSDLYKIGDTKQLLIDGRNYTVRVANKTTPEECDNLNFSQTACGFVVEFVDVVENNIRMNFSNVKNTGGWPASNLRKYSNGDFYNKLPEELRNVIIDTKVVSSYGSIDKNKLRTDGNWDSTDKIFLLSSHEVYEDGTSNKISEKDTAYNQTRQLDYYRLKNVTTNNYSNSVKKFNGPAVAWWLRSANLQSDYQFFIVTYTGSWNTYGGEIGFSPAFRIG